MAKTKNIDLNDNKVQAIVKKVLQAAISSDFGYYEDFQVRGYTDDNKKVRMTMAIIVPESQRSNAKIFLTKKLRTFKYPVGNAGQSGVSLVVNPHPLKEYRQLDVVVGVTPESEEANQVIRVLIKPSQSGGARGGAVGARVTESAQALYCSLRFNVYNSDIPLISSDDSSIISVKDLQKAYESCVFDKQTTFEEVTSIENGWQKSCIMGANKLYKAMNSPAKNLYKFYRGAGIDALLGQAFTKVKKEEPLENVPTGEDKWNPADIWIAKSDFDPNEISKAAARGLVLNLNQFIEEQFNTSPYKNLVGVSLKKITGSAELAVVNSNPVNERATKIKYDGMVKASYKSIDVKMDLGGSKIVQFRNFGAESSGSFQGEIQGDAAAQGKIGGADVWSILNRFGAGFNFDNQTIWRASETEKAGMSREIYMLMKKHQPETLPAIPDNQQEARVVSEITNGDVNDSARSYRYSKRLGLQVIEALENMKKSDADEAVKDMYLYSSSQTKVSSIHWKLT
tara:strand:- start:1110 stop:2642 length:1533 start_codon:yes stop_codon:yes gene_type:complete